MQEIPVGLQFGSVDLGPRLHEAAGADRQLAAQALDRVDLKHRGVCSIVRVEVRAMVHASGFNEHPDHDADAAPFGRAESGGGALAAVVGGPDGLDTARQR